MISFIIPTRNEEKDIVNAITRLQRYGGPHEIIVSDGASTDKTAHLARQAGATVVEYTGAIRQTIAGGRNAGAAVARGEYFVFLDADVIILDPDAFFQTVLKMFETDQKLVAIAPCIRVLPIAETFWDKVIFSFMNYYCRLFNNVFGIGGAAGECQMIRADIFKKLGGYNEKFVAGEDYELFRRLARYGKTRLARKLTVYHTGRRPHQVGWPRLLTQWALNSLSVMLRGRSYSKEWTNIR